MHMICPAGILLLALSALGAVEAPLAELARTGEATLPIGSLAIGCWRSLGAFPRMMKDIAWGAAAGEFKDGRWRYGKGAATIAIDPAAGTISLGNNGHTDHDGGTGTVVVFTPAKPGWYGVHGRIRIGECGNRKSMAWAIARFRDQDHVDVLVDGRARQGTVIDLAQEVGYRGESLSAIELGAGERLALTAWYAPMWDGGGAALIGLDLRPAEPPSAGTVPQPLPRPAPSDADRRFPEQAGLIDVTKPPYSAKGDGVSDDTAVLQRAMEENCRGMLFLPNGTYLVSRQLTWQGKGGGRTSQLSLIGESRAGTIIRLRDRCPRFRDQDEDPADPDARAVLRTETDGGPPDAGISNYIINLTVDTGRGNPGATGISFLGNNNAAIREVTIRSGDGAGLAGLAMLRIPGPCLIQDVDIEGFRYGITMRDSLYNVTCDRLRLRGQSVAGIRNPAGGLCLSDLVSENRVPAILNEVTPAPAPKPGEPSRPPVKNAMLQLVGAKLIGGDPAAAAIVNTSLVYLRDVSTTGYRAALSDEGKDLPGTAIDEYVSGPTVAAFAPQSGSLRLPIESAPPTYHSNDMGQWANIDDYAQFYHYLEAPAPPASTPPLTGDVKPLRDNQRQGQVDHTEALQAALESGKPIVYLPKATWNLTHPLRVPSSVRRIIGMRSSLSALDGASGGWDGAGSAHGVFRIEDGDQPLTIEFVFGPGGNGAGRGGAVLVEHLGKRPLLIRHCVFNGYRGGPSAGPLFIEDCCASNLRLVAPQRAFMRQWNPEGQSLRLDNAGGRAWILGLKTEGGDSVVRTTAGGQSEILGYFFRPSGGLPMACPAFLVEDAALSAIGCSMTWREPMGPRIDRDYLTVLRESRGGVTKTVTRAELVERGLSARDSFYTPLLTAFADRPYHPTTGTPAKSGGDGSGIPAPWRLLEVGHPSAVAQARFTAGGAMVTLLGNGHFTSGANDRRWIGGKRDASSFLACPLPGDGSAVVCLYGFTEMWGPNLKAGLMLRQDASDSCPAVFAGVWARPGKGKDGPSLLMLGRPSGGAELANVAGAEYRLPVWLKLERSGARVSAATSTDGSTWTALGSCASGIAGPALIGLAIAAEEGSHPGIALAGGLTVRDAAGTVIAGPAAGDLPAPWLHDDTAPRLGARALAIPGSATWADGVFSVTGSGWMFNDGKDYCHYVFQPVADGQQIVARVAWDGAAAPPLTAKAGLMLRNLPWAEDAEFATLSRAPDDLVWFRRFAIYGEPGPKRHSAPQPGPVWLKLASGGGRLFSYASADGKAWTLIETAKVQIQTGYCLGFFATSGDLRNAACARFDQVAIGPAEIPEADRQKAEQGGKR